MNLFDLRPQNQKPLDGRTNSGNPFSSHHHNQTQLLFLRRLMRLLDLQRGHVEADGELQLKLLDKAIYSTFLDCLEQEVGDDARGLLHQQETAKQG